MDHPNIVLIKSLRQALYEGRKIAQVGYHVCGPGTEWSYRKHVDLDNQIRKLWFKFKHRIWGIPIHQEGKLPSWYTEETANRWYNWSYFYEKSCASSNELVRIFRRSNNHWWTRDPSFSKLWKNRAAIPGKAPRPQWTWAWNQLT